MLGALARELREEGSVVSPHVTAPRGSAALGALAGSGPATAGEPAYAELVEAVREGYLLHYGTPRLIEGADEDLRLLAGDYLYAKGLERLAALGDLPAVRELCDLISLSAQLHAAEPGSAAASAGALWIASATALATGPSEAHEAAKRALREAGSVQGLLTAARAAAASSGLDEQLALAGETVGLPPFDLG